MRQDYKTKNYIGDGEDTAYEILKTLTSLPEKEHDQFPSIGIYRQIPVTMIYDDGQLANLAEFHRKSSIDIFLISCFDSYSSRECKIAVRVEGKKGSLKMSRQMVQNRYLSKYCQVVDLHKRECEELFKDKLNEYSIKEVVDGFNTARVEILCLK